MNILHIIPNLTKGGAERICLDIANELQGRSDINFLLIVLDEKNQYKELSKNVNIVTTESRLKLKLLGKNQNNLSHLQSIVDEFQPDIIHSHLYLAELYSKHIDSKAKRFAHVHDNMHQLENVSLLNINSKAYLVKYFERKYYDKLADNFETNFLCISNDAKKFIEKNLSNCPINIIKFPNAINTETFNSKQITLVNIGSFVPNKSQSLLIETVYRLKKITNTKIILDLIGDGITKLDCINLSKELQIEDSINFHGVIDNPEFYLKKADLYIHGAKKEAFGLVLIESMSTATPVITTDGKGNRDFMTEGNGILLNHRDPIMFAKEIWDLIQDQDRYKKLQAGALKTAENYDIGPYVDRLLNLYNKAINED